MTQIRQIKNATIVVNREELDTSKIKNKNVRELIETMLDNSGSSKQMKLTYDDIIDISQSCKPIKVNYIEFDYGLFQNANDCYKFEDIITSDLIRNLRHDGLPIEEEMIMDMIGEISHDVYHNAVSYVKYNTMDEYIYLDEGSKSEKTLNKNLKRMIDETAKCDILILFNPRKNY